MVSMTFEEFKKWEKRLVTKKTGPNRGRKAQVVKVFHEKIGELDIFWMAIVYSGAVLVEECVPDNFMFWVDFVKDKQKYLPSNDAIRLAKEMIGARAKNFGLVFNKKTFVIIRHGDFSYLILEALRKQGFLGRPRTLGSLLRSQKKTYKKFKEEWSTRGWGRHYPSTNAMLYEAKGQ